MKFALMVFVHPDDENVIPGTRPRGYWYAQGMKQGALGLFLIEALIVALVVLIAMVT